MYSSWIVSREFPKWFPIPHEQLWQPIGDIPKAWNSENPGVVVSIGKRDVNVVFPDRVTSGWDAETSRDIEKILSEIRNKHGPGIACLFHRREFSVTCDFENVISALVRSEQ